jgi:hypothetical protein
MVLKLRDGSFDKIIAGEEIGGMQLFTEAPNVDILKLKKKKGGVQAPAPASTAEVLFRLHVLRSLSGGPESYAPAGTRVVVGSAGAIALEGERFCHPEEAVLTVRDGDLFLDDLDSGNGVFLRVKGAVELELGDEFVVGDQLLRVEKNPVPDDGPAPDPTYFYSSPKWPSSFRVVQQFEGGSLGACAVARGNALQVGSAVGDLVFPDDPLCPSSTVSWRSRLGHSCSPTSVHERASSFESGASSFWSTATSFWWAGLVWSSTRQLDDLAAVEPTTVG